MRKVLPEKLVQDMPLMNRASNMRKHGSKTGRRGPRQTVVAEADVAASTDDATCTSTEADDATCTIGVDSPRTEEDDATCAIVLDAPQYPGGTTNIYSNLVSPTDRRILARPQRPKQ